MADQEMADMVLIGEYDGALVVLSYLVACLAAYAAVDLTQRVRDRSDDGTRRGLWLMLGAATLGTGMWSMHYIGMLAFTLPIPLGYDLGKTLASLASAVAVAALGLYTASRRDMGGRAVLAGALLMGSGMVAMHYIGMAALEMQPGIDYDARLVGASVAIAVAAAGAALGIVHHLQRLPARAQLPARLGAAATMGAAIAGMHYTGMAAASFPAGSRCLALEGVTATWTAGPLTAFTLAMVALTLWLASRDAALQRRQALEKRRRQEEERARFLAFHDALTGLPNRTQFKHDIANFIGRAARLGRPFDLFYCVFHAPGVRDAEVIDRIAVTLAGRLRGITRGNDLLARHDRLEFVLVRDRLDGDSPAKLRATLLELCRAPVPLDDGVLLPQIHLGMAQYPLDGSNSRNLLLAASRTPNPPQADGDDQAVPPTMPYYAT